VAEWTKELNAILWYVLNRLYDLCLMNQKLKLEYQRLALITDQTNVTKYLAATGCGKCQKIQVQ
jgi:hypothetical protein